MTTVLLPPPHQEEDRPRAGLVAITLGVLIVLMFGLSGWAWWVLHDRLAARPEHPTEARTEVVGVLQTLIGQDTTAAGLADRARRELDSYGWVDRDRRIARIPIERAMELIMRDGRR